MRTTVALATLTAALIAAPAADAATWRGKTSQGRLAKVVTGADGYVSKVRIKYTARCTDGKVLTAGTAFVRPFDAVAPFRFEDGGTYRFRIGRHERARATAWVRGRMGSRGNWRGRYRLRVRVTRGGQYVATCRVRRLTWRARRV